MYRLLIASVAICGLPLLANATVVTDGAFTGWTLSSSFGPGTSAGESGSMTLEAVGGNPTARLNASTFTIVGRALVYDNAIDTNFSTTSALSGAFSLGIDILRGSGDFGAGQGMGLLIQQGSDLYLYDLGTTGSGHNVFTTLSFNGTFTASSFNHIVGAGAATPNFSGGTTTFFGFTASNGFNNVSVTEYYDNFNLSFTSATPEPSTFVLTGCAAMGLVWCRSGRRKLAHTSV